MGLTLLLVALAWHPPRSVQKLDGQIYDFFLRAAPHRPAGAVPVVVDIDEESLARHGQWPWPRYRVAQLLERLRDLGAAAVALDLVFAEPDRTSLPLIVREIERDLGLSFRVEAPPGAIAGNDRRLADVLETGPFVLGYAFDFGAGSPREDCLLHPIGAIKVHHEAGRGLVRAPGVVCNLPSLARAAGASGFFNVAPDPDGTVRSVPLLIEYRGNWYPSLALAALIRSLGEAPVRLESHEGFARHLIVAGHEIPVDPRGMMLVRFRGAGRGYGYLSAAAVLEGRVPASALSGRVAFVGTTAAGLKELRATPLDPVFPGPEVHAAALDTILQGDFLERPQAAHGWELLAALLMGTLATFVFSRSGAAAGLPLLVFGSAALWGGTAWLFARAGAFLSPLLPQTVLAGTFALLSFLRFRQSEREAAEFFRKLSLTQDVVIQSMAALAETRDNETGGHIQRTRHYVKLLAELLRGHPRFRDWLDEQSIELLYKLAPLHDIGKVGVRDSVLLKAGRLTREEFEEMKRHTIYGDDTLQIAEQRLADVYDALVSRRVYKEPLSHEQAAALLREGRGTHFDPDILDVFLAHQSEFKAIASRFADPSWGRGTDSAGVSRAEPAP